MGYFTGKPEAIPNNSDTHVIRACTVKFHFPRGIPPDCAKNAALMPVHAKSA